MKKTALKSLQIGQPTLRLLVPSWTRSIPNDRVRRRAVLNCRGEAFDPRTRVCGQSDSGRRHDPAG